MTGRKFSNKCPLMAINKLYLDEATADVHFAFESIDGHRELVPGHKLLLSANSDVFQAMFNGLWKEQEECEIVDASAAAFKEFLQFFYCEKVEITTENIEEVLHLGQKYIVDQCCAVCENFLTNSLTIENVCSTYRLSLALQKEELKKFCEVTICLNPKEVFATQDFLECDRETLSKILQLKSLYCFEVDVFVASMNWVKAISKQTELDKETVYRHLGDDLFSIRFGSIAPDELNDIFASYGKLFVAGLRSEIIERIQSDKMIAKRERNFVWYNLDVIELRQKLSDTVEKPYQLQTNESINVMANKLLLLRDVVCGKIMTFRNYHRVEPTSDNFYADLTIYECCTTFEGDLLTPRIVYRKHTLIREVITLDQPVIIKPNVDYKICFNIGEKAASYFANYLFEDSEIEAEYGQITMKFGIVGTEYDRGRSLICGLNFYDT